MPLVPVSFCSAMLSSGFFLRGSSVQGKTSRTRPLSSLIVPGSQPCARFSATILFQPSSSFSHIDFSNAFRHLAFALDPTPQAPFARPGGLLSARSWTPGPWSMNASRLGNCTGISRISPVMGDTYFLCRYNSGRLGRPGQCGDVWGSGALLVVVPACRFDSPSTCVGVRALILPPSPGAAELRRFLSDSAGYKLRSGCKWSLKAVTFLESGSTFSRPVYSIP
mmetsp:Transcript_55512/g.121576  ORF Transcript_55512/g.121576 Transcript_55512/m.121576 type:complete len:223 (+) Transcript_55512:798-1466(+)